MILRQGVQVSIAGLMIPLPLVGCFLTHVLASFLYGVSALNPVTFAAVPALLLLADSHGVFDPRDTGCEVYRSHANPGDMND